MRVSTRLSTGFSIMGIAAALLVGRDACAADSGTEFDDAWRIYVGVLMASVNSYVEVYGPALSAGTQKIQVEDTLGVPEKKSVAWGGVDWRFADKHSVELELFGLHRGASGSDVFDPAIQLGDVYVESGEVGTSYDTEVGRLTYNYLWRRSARSHLNTKVGVHWARLSAGFNLAGAICSPNTVPSIPPGCPTQETGFVSQDVSAPLLHVGASYTYAATDSVSLRLGAMGFALELDGIDGSIIELDADVAWQPFEQVGFGLGARYFKTRVESRGSKLNGAFDFEYYGVAAFLQVTF